MSTKKTIGYVKRLPSGDASFQREAIAAYCADCGYELLSYYEADGSCTPSQIERLENYIRNELAAGGCDLTLIPASIGQISRSVDEFQSAMIILHENHIEIEPIRAHEQEIVAQYYRKTNPMLDLLVNLKAPENKATTPQHQCRICGDVMTRSTGCSCHTIRINGKDHPRVRFGREDFEWPDECCPDCGAAEGQCHHAGCDVEECPGCGDQLIGCECEYEFVL